MDASHVCTMYYKQGVVSSATYASAACIFQWRLGGENDRGTNRGGIDTFPVILSGD